jgi:hypothetical protein
MAHQVARGELGHLPGADDQHRLGVEVLKDLLRQLDRRGTDGNGLLADARCRAHALGDREGPLEDLIEPGAGGLGAACDGEGCLDLGGDLRLSHHQRVETGDDAE